MGQFRKIFKLRQNTPIWHFQHNQYGAILRATEVKPKLDRFLIANDDGSIKDEWYLKGENIKSLDYKLRIYSSSSPYKADSFPLFFGNMGSSKKPEELNVSKKKALFFKGDIFLEIFSFHTGLLTIVEKSLPDFFFIHNFGTRQSKGFGSFSILDDSQDTADVKQEYKVENGCELKLLSSFKLEGKTHTQVFQAVDLFYKSIRGGVLGKMDPVLVEWLRNKNGNLEWDRKVMAKLFKPVKGIVPSSVENPGKDFMYRDYLGLATDSFVKPWRATISKKSKTIERFKSPVFIKPIKNIDGYSIYVGYYNTVEKLKNAQFEVTSTNRKGKFTLKLFPDFRLEDYLKYCIDNGGMFVKHNYKGKGDDKTLLLAIYKELRENKILLKGWKTNI